MQHVIRQGTRSILSSTKTCRTLASASSLPSLKVCRHSHARAHSKKTRLSTGFADGGIEEIEHVDGDQDALR